MPGFAITVLINADDADSADVVRGKIAAVFAPPTVIPPVGIGVAQVSDEDL